MHVTACLAGEKVDVEVGEGCCSLQALKEIIAKELPQLCVEGFDVSVGGRALDNDERVLSLDDSVRLDVVPNTRGLSVLSLREAGREVSEAGLLCAVEEGDVALCTLYLDANVITCGGARCPLFASCYLGHLDVARLLLDRSSAAIDEKDGHGNTPLLASCSNGHVELARLLLDRGSTAIDEKNDAGNTPLHVSCCYGHAEVARLLLDRSSTAINENNGGNTPLLFACRRGHVKVARLLLDRGSYFDVEQYLTGKPYPLKILGLLLERGHDVLHNALPESAKRRRIGEQ